MSEIVPGLQRGFYVLSFLSDGVAKSLDEITKQTGYPKASVLRMLYTLEQIGAVERDVAGKEYRALSVITSIEGNNGVFNRLVDNVLAKLSAETGLSGEWFIPQENGMYLARRASPPTGELWVIARTGYTRNWYDEFDCVAILGHTFANPNKKSFSEGSIWQYTEEGGKKNLTHDQILQILKTTKLAVTQAVAKVDSETSDETISDPFFNSNGVLRIAHGVFDKDSLKGVLALALPFRPDYKQKMIFFKKTLTKYAKELNHHLKLTS